MKLLPEITPKLTPERFWRWLERQDPETELGSATLEDNDPLANYIGELCLAPRYAVSIDDDWVRLRDAESQTISALPTPLWIQDTYKVYDKGGYHPITAGLLRRLLQDDAHWMSTHLLG